MFGHLNRTAAPSPAPPTGSSNAPAPIPWLNPNISADTSGIASSVSTSISEAKSGEYNDRPGPWTPQPQSGPRSNSFPHPNQSLQQYPPSSSPAAAATLAAASLPKFKTEHPSSSPVGTAAGSSVPPSASGSTAPDARTLTTSFTTHDFKTPSSNIHASTPGRRPLPTPLSSSPASATLPAFPYLPPLGFRSPSPSGGLQVVTSLSPLFLETSPVAPTPPPKSLGAYSFPSPPPSTTRPSADPLPSVFMGSSQSKPAAAPSPSNSTRSQPPGHRLQKANPHQQVLHAPSSSLPSTLSTGSIPARGRISRSPSPAPRPSTPQSQVAPALSRSPLASSSTPAPPMSASGSSSSTTSKLKRAFAARRKKSGDASTSLNMFGKSNGTASTLSLVQQPKAVVESETMPSRSIAQKQLATQLLGPSINTPSSGPRKVPSRSEVEVGTTTLLLSPLETTGSTSQASGGSGRGRNVNRASIIQLSPGITSAVDYMREMVGSEEVGRQRDVIGIDAGVETKKDQVDKKSGAVDGRKTDEGPGKVELVPSRAQSPFPSSSTAMAAASSSSPLPLQLSMPLSSVGKEVESRERDGREPEGERKDQKENWRKSDSTIGHHTIRNIGASANGARTSRPVSMAESFQSAYTIVPSGGGGTGSIGGNKRWSTVTGDLDFQVMMEEAVEEEEEANSMVASGSRSLNADEIKATSLPSAKNINRRSLSLNVGISNSAKPLITPAYVNVAVPSHRTTEAETRPISYSVSESGPIRSSTLGVLGNSPPNSYTHSTSNSRGLPHQPYHVSQPQATHIQSQSVSSLATHQFLQDQYRQHQATGSLPSNAAAARLPAWTVTPPTASLNPSLPPPSMSNYHGSSAPVSFRQTAISMSNGFAKRAAEKIGGIGKKWGLSTSSSGSGYSSSSSRDQGPQPSSYSSSQSHLDHGVPLGRTHSNHSNQSSLASSMKSATSLSSGITSGVVHHVHLPGRDKNKDRDKKKRRTPNAPSGAYSVSSSVTSASTSESDGFPTGGPILGRLLRGPMKNPSGVFGRDLIAVVSQTRAVPTFSREEDPRSRHEGDREKLVKDLEHRMLPALVVRCAQHILIWGVQEEGLFRVSGRASHVTKLRSEFDAGVDYDLTDCAPGDLDPHAVSSVFKAYLRELPESILTRRLHRLFENALTKELASYPPQPTAPNKVTTLATPGMPGGPKADFNNSIRKAPSLSTLAMPSFNGMPAASHTLINALRSLIAQLPLENRDLTRTVVDLIRATAAASKSTKMPLSNLLLVFCPSLNMSPPLLKALCEAEGIWDALPDEVLDIKRQTIMLDTSGYRTHDDDDDDYSDAREALDSERQSLQSVDLSEHPSSDYHASAENSMLEEASSPRKRDISQRPIVPTVYLDSQSRCSSSSLSSTQDDIEPSPQEDRTRSPPLTSSSVDSLDTPASAGNPPFVHDPIQDSKANNMIDQAPSRVFHKISESMRLPDRKDPRQPTIVIPGAFDVEPASVQFPISPPTPRKRRSIPLLSLSSFSPISPSAFVEPPSPTGGPGLRGKKPSLRRLFTKRSIASIGSGSSGKHRNSLLVTDSPDSPYLCPPRSASDSSSVSTPLSAVTAPQSSTSHLPPVLDTAIENSSFRLSLGMDMSPTDSSEDISSVLGTGNTDKTFYASARSSIDPSPVASPLDTQLGHDFNRRGLGSPPPVASSSSNHLGLLHGDGEGEDDWTRSVLIAVGAKRV